MNLARTLVGAALSSQFDPQPVVFRAEDERGVALVRQACLSKNDSVQKLRSILNRNAFLVGCLDFTEGTEIEHLIVGFGTRYGRTTKISRLMHVIGGKNSVAPTVTMQTAVENHIRANMKGEVIVFHNHPMNWLNTVFDNMPIASGQDRSVMLRQLVEPYMLFRALLGGGRVMFYLGENGFVRRFHTPELLDMLERIAG